MSCSCVELCHHVSDTHPIFYHKSTASGDQKIAILQRMCCTFYLYLSMSKSHLTQYLSKVMDCVSPMVFWPGKYSHFHENRELGAKIEYVGSGSGQPWY